MVFYCSWVMIGDGIRIMLGYYLLDYVYLLRYILALFGSFNLISLRYNGLFGGSRSWNDCYARGSFICLVILFY
jgi:hypothetical protein